MLLYNDALPDFFSNRCGFMGNMFNIFPKYLSFIHFSFAVVQYYTLEVLRISSWVFENNMKQFKTGDNQLARRLNLCMKIINALLFNKLISLPQCLRNLRFSSALYTSYTLRWEKKNEAKGSFEQNHYYFLCVKTMKTTSSSIETYTDWSEH